MNTIEDHEGKLRSAVTAHARAIYDAVIQDFIKRVTAPTLKPAKLIMATPADPIKLEGDFKIHLDRPTIRCAITALLTKQPTPIRDLSLTATVLLRNHGVKIKPISVYKEVGKMRTQNLLTDGSHGLVLI